MKETGTLHSTAVLAPAGGLPPRGVEFHYVRDGDGEGRHASWMREIPLDAAAVRTVTPPETAAETRSPV